MKNIAPKLDVDCIGGQRLLTKSEEKSISEFIKAQKLLEVAKCDIQKRKMGKRK